MIPSHGMFRFNTKSKSPIVELKSLGWPSGILCGLPSVARKGPTPRPWSVLSSFLTHRLSFCVQCQAVTLRMALWMWVHGCNMVCLPTSPFLTLNSTFSGVSTRTRPLELRLRPSRALSHHFAAGGPRWSPRCYGMAVHPLCGHCPGPLCPGHSVRQLSRALGASLGEPGPRATVCCLSPGQLLLTADRNQSPAAWTPGFASGGPSTRGRSVVGHPRLSVGESGPTRQPEWVLPPRTRCRDAPSQRPKPVGCSTPFLTFRECATALRLLSSFPPSGSKAGTVQPGAALGDSAGSSCGSAHRELENASSRRRRLAESKIRETAPGVQKLE